MTSAFHDSQLEGGLREGWTEAVLEELVVHALGGDWGVSCEPEVPAGRVRVSVLRGTEFKRWDQEKGRMAAERAIKRTSLAKRELRPGDLVVEISGGGPDQPVGRSLLIDEAAVRDAKNPLVCSNFCRQVRLHPDVDPAYVALVLRHRYERGDVNDCQSQTTNLRNLDFAEFLAGVTVPLPPLHEQRRIVAQAGELLAQAYQVRRRLALLPAVLRRFRQSVLAHAFSGRLTARWRVRRSDREAPRFSDATEWQVPEPLEVPEIPESWTLVALDDLVTRVQHGMSVKADGDAGSGVPMLRMPNIQDGRLDLSDLKYVKRGAKGLQRFLLEPGDVLFNRSNSPNLVGKAAVVDVDREMVFASYVVRLICDDQRVSSRFVCAWINSPWGRQWAHTVRTDGVGQSNIKASNLRRMPVPTPPLTEQLEIVRRMENLFRFADAVESRVATATAEADKLAQAVLDQALRGELVPTEAELARQEGRSYEPGWVLLGRVKAERGRLRVQTGRKSGRASGQPATRRDARRSRPVAVYGTDQILIAFRQSCWGAGAVSDDELIRRVADRLEVARLGRKIRARFVDHLEIAIERRIVARRGDALEGATPTFARYDDEFLLQALRAVLRSGVGYEAAAAVRLVASHLGYGQVTGALRGRMEALFREGVQRGILIVGDGKVWRRG
jgi:type I restriction enzyme S subunit